MSTEHDKVRKILGDNLRGLMHLHFIRTYSDLVALMRIDMSSSGLSPYFSGKGGRLEVIAALAEVFDVSTADLLTDGFAEGLRSRLFEATSNRITDHGVRPMQSQVIVPEPVAEVPAPVSVPEPVAVDRKPEPEWQHHNFHPDPDSRSTLLYLMDRVGLSASQVRRDLGLRDSQSVYNFLNTGATTLAPSKVYIASYLAAKLGLSISDVHQLRGQKGMPATG